MADKAKKQQRYIIILIPVITVLVVLGILALVLSGPAGAQASSKIQNMRPDAHMGDHMMDKDKGETKADVKCAFPEWIGKPVDEQAVEKAAGDRPFRIYGETDMVTMDYSPQRLNVITDSDGVVIKTECG